MLASWRGRRGLVRTAIGGALSPLLLLALLPAGAPAASAVVPAPGPTSPTSGNDAAAEDVHVVVLRGRPSAAYLGGLDGIPRTSPRPGERFDRTRPAVATHTRRLLRQQDRVLARVGDPDVLYRYTTTVHGFAARLTEDQVRTLTRLASVRWVEQARVEQLSTSSSAESLGAARAWTAVGGSDRAGRGQVVGVVDSGIWPENPSFAGVPLAPGELPEQLPGFHGTCAGAEQWDAQDCDDKVVAARWFGRGFGPSRIARSEYLSPRDGSGHGSHTAAIAAGNADVRVDVDGQDFGTVSGMAPAARIAAYKACWTAPDPEDDGCHSADTLAAVDQAVADGVDVLSYSVGASGAAEAPRSLDLAFLNATTAGVFVAAAAGNDGPTAGTVDHTGPWVTTVGASSHHLLQGALVLGDGTRLVGAMVSDDAVREAPLVLASQAAEDAARPDAARLCEAGALDASAVRGRIVVCERGRIARVEKSAAVARAGGVGMVLSNTVPGSVDADFHAVPTVHVDAADANRVETYTRTTGEPVASFDPAGTDDTEVPRVAAFSSRGPGEPDGSVLKPELVAPGVSVLGAVAPPTDGGRLWDLRSGTSMSAPHVAGLAAMLLEARPGWSAAEVRSALMTTAAPVDAVARPLAEGAGVPDAVAALDPGLTFEVEPGEYRSYLRGSREATQLNLPSIAVGDLTGTTRVVRRVTNVSETAETFAAQVDGLDDVEVRVRPASLSLSPGETGRFRVTLTAQPGLGAGDARAGTLTWTGPSHRARVPVTVRSQAVDAPDEVVADVADSRLEVDATSGTASPGVLRPLGLVADTPVGLALTPGDFAPGSPTADADTDRFTTSVPPDTAVFRVELVGHRTADDMDLHVYRDGEPVAASTTPGSSETVTLVDPEPGEYAVYARSVSAGNGSTTAGQLYSWVVPDKDAANVALTPAQSDPGVGDDLGFTLEWGDLSGVTRWFGAVRYGDTGELTLVSLR